MIDAKIMEKFEREPEDSEELAIVLRLDDLY